MSDESNKKKAKHGKKINQMTVAEAKATMTKCETSNDRGSKYYMLCKAVATGQKAK